MLEKDQYSQVCSNYEDLILSKETYDAQWEAGGQWQSKNFLDLSKCLRFQFIQFILKKLFNP